MVERRAEVIEQVTNWLVADHPGDRPRRVGVDGITAAGKTTWADELTAAVRARGCPALHISTDDFHFPRARRYRQGRTSAAGYYADAYDFPALAAHVLRPLGRGGDRRIRPRVHDLASDQPIDTDPCIARVRAVQRDAALFGDPQAVDWFYRTRYHAACALYADDADPARRAGILIDNNDLNHPFVRCTTDCRG